MASFARMTRNISDYGWFNGTENAKSSIDIDPSLSISAGFTLLVSLVGLNANSLVIWFLSFKLRRTKYTKHIINLAIANVICLILVTIAMSIAIIYFEGEIEILYPIKVIFALEVIRGLGIYGAVFFLGVISIDRYLSIVWSTWYRYNCPRSPSYIVCIPIWSFALMMSLIENFGCPPENYGVLTKRCTAIHAFVAIFVLCTCMPIMVISSVFVYIRIQRSSSDSQSSRFSTVIMASIIILCLTLVPLRFIRLLLYLHALPNSFSPDVFFFSVYMFISLNCTLNPLIYFLVGNQNLDDSDESFVQASLMNVFEEEEEA